MPSAGHWAGSRLARAPLLTSEAARPPRFLGNPSRRALLFDPGGPPRPTTRRFGVAFRLTRRRRRPRQFAFEAHSHGPLTCCLRFVTSVARRPRKTRFRLAVTLGRAGPRTPQGSSSRFQLIHPPRPGFAWRTVSSKWSPGTALGSAVAVAVAERTCRSTRFVRGRALGSGFGGHHRCSPRRLGDGDGDGQPAALCSGEAFEDTA